VLPGGASVKLIAGMDSRQPERDGARPPGAGFAPPPAEFDRAREQLETELGAVLGPGDVVIAHNLLTTHLNLPLTAALYRLADQGRLGPLVAWCHDLSRYVNPASGDVQRYGYPWDLLRQPRPDVTYVAVSSFRQQALARVLDLPPEAIQVIPNGVDAPLLLGLSAEGVRLAERYGLLSADLVLLMPVRLTRAKNIEFALQVAAALKADGLALRLVVTGPPDPHAADAQDYFGRLRALRRELRLDDEAVFLAADYGDGGDGSATAAIAPPLTPERVAELFRLCDVVLMPSLREGFGMPVLEAGLAGKPVYATSIPVVQDVGSNLVQLIGRDETPASVARRLAAWAARDPIHRLRRLTRQTYTWPAIFSRCLQPLVEDQVAGRSQGDRRPGARRA
jgi:glycosyltransferase involved in cell wall biosynthesis